MRTLEVDGLFNVRASRDRTPWLVRSGATEALTDAGAAVLSTLGVSLILDLREPSERGPARHGIPVRSIPVYGTEPPAVGGLEEIYENLLRRRAEALARAVGVVADADGAVLVHCTAGKDRTGLVVALARSAAGESAEAIVADYVLSAAEVRPVRQAHADRIVRALSDADRAATLRLHLESPAEAIGHALAVIDALGGADRYLREHGLSEDQLRALRRKNDRASGDAA
ncbi:tyrosine-protein phosphatase [Microbacterium oleivorans]|uniref:Tyrosine-protein phosphatase n=1 Tax=Microbacterium oleivorans TaxID=273677 RepID=A0A7D5F943_9MICO|nr:tyrosine-protein phosphatase [Microbacterium oleivorans]QLD11689.1 tyrosine-protein phosphatase [Microbacterium oleivorans]